MGSRALSSLLLGEHYGSVRGVVSSLRQITTSSLLMTGEKSGGLRGPGIAAPNEGSKDMSISDRETVTEGSESPKDVAEDIKDHKDAGKDTMSKAEELKGKPPAPEGPEVTLVDLNLGL
jgi:hypothetical protein